VGCRVWVFAVAPGNVVAPLDILLDVTGLWTGGDGCKDNGNGEVGTIGMFKATESKSNMLLYSQWLWTGLNRR